jgi:hypothetical protein
VLCVIVSLEVSYCHSAKLQREFAVSGIGGMGYSISASAA